MKSQKSLPKPKKPKLRWPFQLREVSGHSMMPVLPPGTLVIGLRWYRKLKPGNIVIFCHEGKEKIKRMQDQNDTQVYVVGDYKIASTDSRQFGWIDKDEVRARVIWPHAPKHRAEGVEKEV